MKWVIILLIYFQNSDRVDYLETSYYFENGVQGAKFKADKNFSELLKESFQGKEISIIKPICKPMEYNIDSFKEKYIASNGSVGICSMSSCIWK